MTFEVVPATDDDFALIVPPLFNTMGMAGFVAALYPDNQTENGQKKAIERFKLEKDKHPGIRWLKVVDTSVTGENGQPQIVGTAQWAVLDDATQHYPEYIEIATAAKDTWANDLDEEYAKEMWEGYIRTRRNVLKVEKLPVVCLQILCVWPEYQNRGAGSKLMKWGNDLADSIGAVCTVEASGAGMQLYEKWGYELQDDYPLEVSEKFRHRLTSGRIRFMVRHRRRLQTDA